MPKPRKAKKSSPTVNKDTSDWIASLVQQPASNNNAMTSGGTTKTPSNDVVPSKEDRIQKRAAKKARRQQRQEERKRPVALEKNTRGATAATAMMPQRRATNQDSTKQRLDRLGKLLLAIQNEHQNDKQQRLYTLDEEATRIKRKRPLNEVNIQPQPSDYSGIGLARKSLFLAFQDPSHIPKLEEEFAEHIPGFFGKQRTKAMKRQLDGKMLWRKLADLKQTGGGGMPKKFAHLSPDERVQVMIDAGMM